MTKYQETVEALKKLPPITEKSAEKTLSSVMALHLDKLDEMPGNGIALACYTDCIIDVMCATHEAGGDIMLFKAAKDKIFRSFAKLTGNEELFEESR